MAISKIGSKALVDCSVATADLEDGSVSNAKLANSSITINGTSVSLGASASLKDISWQSVITASGGSNTAVAGEGYFIDTTSDTHTVTLPASPSIGDKIAIKDYAGTFGTNNLTIGRNGNNIQGVANDSLITTNRASIILVYSDATKGWLYTVESNVADLGEALFLTATGGTITTSGDFKIHTFTGDGCFVVSQLGNPTGGPNNVDYVIVAGGGGGSSYIFGAGAGGGGGFRESHTPTVGGSYTASPLSTPVSLSVSTTTYPITVGAGGAGTLSPGGTPPGIAGASGNNSIFSTITSAGGGGGGYTTGLSGGSGGGGGGAASPTSAITAGTGNTPPVAPPQGSNGGTGKGHPSGPERGGGGGGGATIVGKAFTGNSGPEAGDGGAGTITGATTSAYPGPVGPGGFSGGGAGSGGSFVYAGQPGGYGGGFGAFGNAGSGTTNSGGGGGASGANGSIGNGGNGGSGIVVIRYKFQ